MSEAGLRVIEASGGWAIGELDRCVCVVWRAQPTPEAFRARNAALLELAKNGPKRCALVEIVEATSKPPSDETRRVAMEVFKGLGNDLSAIAIQLEGNHVKSSLNRAILTGMMFFVKQLQPTKIFKHTTDATKWVNTYMKSEDPGFESKLAAALEELRRAIR